MTVTAIKDLRKEVKKYLDLADERMLKAIHAMLEKDMEEELSDEDISPNWMDEMSLEEQASMEEGVRQLENGEGIPHAEVMKKYGKWLTK